MFLCLQRYLLFRRNRHSKWRIDTHETISKVSHTKYIFRFLTDTLTIKTKDKDGQHMNNMDLGYEMFCYQCEQTANGKGCTKLGVCGKTPEIANLQDLLIFQIKGISCYGKVLQNEGQHIDKNIIRFIENVLFTTLTNVNFDSKVHVELLNESQRIKENLRTITGEIHNQTSYATYDLPETKTQMLFQHTKAERVERTDIHFVDVCRDVSICKLVCNT